MRIYKLQNCQRSAPVHRIHAYLRWSVGVQLVMCISAGIVRRKIVPGRGPSERRLQVPRRRPARSVPRKRATVSRQRAGRGGGRQRRWFGLVKVVPRVVHVGKGGRRSDRRQWRQHRTCFRSVARQRRRGALKLPEILSQEESADTNNTTFLQYSIVYTQGCLHV